jgi:hypothetical protein
MHTKRNTSTLIKSSLRSSTLMLVVLMVIFSSCKHELEEVGIYGDEYASAPEGFYLQTSLTASTNSIDFETSTVSFNAALSDKVTWVITITGNTSGAVKVINGFSNIIDVTNANWDGNSSNEIFFLEGETCTATLSFLGTSLTSTIPSSITIVKDKKYEGVLVSDFDGNGEVTNGQWFSYSDKVGTIDDVVSYGVKSDMPSVQGTNYIHMRGIDQAGNWYIGGMGYYVSFGLPAKLTALSSDPNEIYLNMYVNGNGTTNTKLAIRLTETDGKDAFLKETPITWTGWKLVSIKLADFPFYAPESQPGGNGIVDKLDKLVFIPQPAAPGATNEINVDYIIFTKGPFQH